MFAPKRPTISPTIRPTTATVAATVADRLAAQPSVSFRALFVQHRPRYDGEPNRRIADADSRQLVAALALVAAYRRRTVVPPARHVQIFRDSALSRPADPAALHSGCARARRVRAV